MATIMSVGNTERKTNNSAIFTQKAMESVRQQRVDFVTLVRMTRRIGENFDSKKFFERHNTELGEAVLEKLIDGNVKAIGRMEESFDLISHGTSLMPPFKVAFYGRILEREKERLREARENYFQWKMVYSDDPRCKIAL